MHFSQRVVGPSVQITSSASPTFGNYINQFAVKRL